MSTREYCKPFVIVIGVSEKQKTAQNSFTILEFSCQRSYCFEKKEGPLRLVRLKKNGMFIDYTVRVEQEFIFRNLQKV